MNYRLSALIYFLFLPSIWGSEKANWWDRPRVEDIDHIYYNACSSDKKDSDEELENLSFKKCMRFLFEEHFPSVTQTKALFEQNLKNESLLFQMDQNSCPIKMKGFVRNKKFKYKHQGINTLCLQLKIKKSDIQSASLLCDTPIKEGNRYDGLLPLKVSSNFMNIRVTFIHQEKNFLIEGTIPQTFLLPIGKYEVKVNEPGHEQYSKFFHHFSDNDDLFIKLNPIKVPVSFWIKPEDSKIFIDDVMIDDKEVHLFTRRAYRLRISHDDYYPLETEIELLDDGPLSQKYALTPRPTIASFEVIPPVARIFIDDEQIDPSKGRITILPGKRQIKVSATGYETFEKNFYFQPNREHPREKIELTKIQPNSDTSLSFEPLLGLFNDYSHRFEFTPYISTKEKSYFSLLNLNYFLQFSHFNLGAGFFYKGPLSLSGIYEADYFSRHIDLRLSLLKNDWYQMYGTFITGQISQLETLNGGKYATTNDYHGFGLGLRTPLFDSISFLSELHFLNIDNSLTLKKEYKTNLQFGLGYDF